jgi:hypothetical protein
MARLCSPGTGKANQGKESRPIWSCISLSDAYASGCQVRNRAELRLVDQETFIGHSLAGSVTTSPMFPSASFGRYIGREIPIYDAKFATCYDYFFGFDTSNSRCGYCQHQTEKQMIRRGGRFGIVIGSPVSVIISLMV